MNGAPGKGSTGEGVRRMLGEKWSYDGAINGRWNFHDSMTPIFLYLVSPPPPFSFSRTHKYRIRTFPSLASPRAPTTPFLSRTWSPWWLVEPSQRKHKYAPAVTPCVARMVKRLDRRDSRSVSLSLVCCMPIGRRVVAAYRCLLRMCAISVSLSFYLSLTRASGG